MINKLLGKLYTTILVLLFMLIVDTSVRSQISEDNIGEMELLQTYPLENNNLSYWFNNDGSVAAINQGEEIYFIDTDTLQVINTVTLSLASAPNEAEQQPETVTGGGFILGNNHFVIGTSAGSPFRDFGSLLLWNTSQEEGLQTLEDMISIENITVSIEGDYLAYTRGLDEVVVMDTENRDLLYTFIVDGRFGGAPVFSPTETLLALILQGGSINLVNAEYDTIDTIVSGLIAHDIIFSPLGNAIAMWDDKVVELWDVNTLQQVANFEISSDTEGFIVDIDINQRENKLVMAGSQLSSEGNLIVFDLYSGNQMFVTNVHTDSVFTVAFDPINQLLVSAGRDGTVKIWDIENFGMPIYETIVDGAVLNVDFSPDGEYIFAQTASELTIWGIID